MFSFNDIGVPNMTSQKKKNILTRLSTYRHTGLGIYKLQLFFNVAETLEDLYWNMDLLGNQA